MYKCEFEEKKVVNHPLAFMVNPNDNFYINFKDSMEQVAQKDGITMEELWRAILNSDVGEWERIVAQTELGEW